MNGSSAENGSNSCIPNGYSFPTKVAQTVLYAFVLVVSLFGNALVIYIATQTKRINKTTTNFLIANMASSDLLISMFAIPRTITEIHVGQSRWLVAGLLGQLSCKLIYFFQDISTAVSIESLVFITVDRFVAVVFPYRGPIMSLRTCKFVVIPLIWIIATAIHSPYFYLFRLQEIQNQTHCIPSWTPAFQNEKKVQKQYYLVILVVLILLPLLLLAILYSAIIFHLRVKSKKHCPSTARCQRRVREDSKVIKKVVTIVIVFVICIIPINVFGVLLYFVWDLKIPCGAKDYIFASYFVLFSNSAINPCVYFILNERYRRELGEVVTRLSFFHSKKKSRKRLSTSAMVTDSAV